MFLLQNRLNFKVLPDGVHAERLFVLILIMDGQ